MNEQNDPVLDALLCAAGSEEASAESVAALIATIVIASSRQPHGRRDRRKGFSGDTHTYCFLAQARQGLVRSLASRPVQFRAMVFISLATSKVAVIRVEALNLAPFLMNRGFEDVEKLVWKKLAFDPDPWVREMCSWAFYRFLHLTAHTASDSPAYNARTRRKLNKGPACLRDSAPLSEA